MKGIIQETNKHGIGKEGDVSFIQTQRVMIRLMRQSIRGGEFCSWNMMEFDIEHKGSTANMLSDKLASELYRSKANSYDP
jgi:hypothetical protein